MVVFLGSVISNENQTLIFNLWANVDLVASITVLFIRSDLELDWGWFGVMVLCVVPLLHRNGVMIRDVYTFAL